METKVINGVPIVDAPETEAYIENVRNLPNVPGIIKENDIVHETKVRIETPKASQPDDTVAPSAIEYWELVRINGVRHKRPISEKRYYESKL